MLIFNSDGTEALMCGNGLRCFALFCYEKGIIKESSFDVITKGGIMKVNITSFNPFYASINLGKAFFDHELLSINSFIRPFIKQTLNILNQSYEIHTVFLGIIHTVVFVSNLEKIIKTKVGSLICSHELFPMKTNVNFVQIIDRKSFYIKTFERGVGWTESCGTGAASSFFIANYLGLCDEDAKAILPFCTLKITRLPDDTIALEGPAVRIVKLKIL